MDGDYADDEIHAAGLLRKDIGGSQSVKPRMAISRSFHVAVLLSTGFLGPFGTLVGHLPEHISRVRCLHGASQEAIDKLHGSTGSACGRYFMEHCLRTIYENGFGAREGAVETEFDLSRSLRIRWDGRRRETKVVMILEEIIPRFV
jgi:hypothetical protein